MLFGERCGWSCVTNISSTTIVVVDLPRIEHFIDTDYHRPSDKVRPGLELGGAAEDVPFLAALAKWLADPKKVALTGK